MQWCKREREEHNRATDRIETRGVGDDRTGCLKRGRRDGRHMQKTEDAKTVLVTNVKKKKRFCRV